MTSSQWLGVRTGESQPVRTGPGLRESILLPKAVRKNSRRGGSDWSESRARWPPEKHLLTGLCALFPLNSDPSAVLAMWSDPGDLASLSPFFLCANNGDRSFWNSAQGGSITELVFWTG